ncbi:hypothetical protein PM082_008669 [Marasmius tenuissimus]|nr:hypothetical protein PM082_008669 [Marasmius tenuissimus]
MSTQSRLLFSSALQPGIVSLFSSTGSDPLSIFSQHIDYSLPADSFIHFLNDQTSEPVPPKPAALITVTGTNEDERERYSLCQTVLHIQSPTLRTTFIQCPPVSRSLGFKHAWIQFQLRDIGRECSLEVGVVDHMGREGRIRLSTFQQDPRLKVPSSTAKAEGPSKNHLPLVHLPLSFPPTSSRPLTSWATITLNLPNLIPYFTSLAVSEQQEANSADSDTAWDQRRSRDRNITLRTLPNGTYSHVSYVRVYATCRLRRIWFSESRPSQTHNNKVPWEFELYGSGTGTGEI